MRLRIQKRTEGVPDSYRYTHPETGHTTRAVDPWNWLEAIKKYRRDNHLPIPDDMQAIAEDQLCKFMPPGICKYEDGSVPTDFINTRLDLDAVDRGSAVLLAFISEGMPLVPKEVAEERGAICAACPANVGISGCGPCKVMQKLVDFLGSTSKTKADPQLESKSCAVCGCSSRLQIHLPIEVLAKGVTPEQQARFDRIEHCWKSSESLRELETT